MIMRRKSQRSISLSPQRANPKKVGLVDQPYVAPSKKPTVVSGKVGAANGNRAVQVASAAEGTRVAEAGRAARQSRQPTVASTRAVLSGTAARQPMQAAQPRTVRGQIGAASNPNARAATAKQTTAKAMPKSRSLMRSARQMVASSKKKV